MQHLPYIFLALLEGAVMAALLSLMAVGFSLVFGIMRVVNIAHGQFFMLGAVIGWAIAEFLRSYYGASAALAFAVALPTAVAAVVALSAIADKLVLRRLHYEPQATIVATIGLLYIFQQSALSLYGAEARAVEPPFYVLVQFPWYGYSLYKLLIILVAALVLLGVWLLLERTRLGLKMRAVAYDRETAAAFAIAPFKIYSGVFALSAGLAALAGILALPIRQAHYLMGDEVLLLSFMVVIIGGLGSLRGTIWAAILIGLSDALVSLLFSPVLAKIIATLLVAGVLIIRPQGLFGVKDSGGSPASPLFKPFFKKVMKWRAKL